MKNLTIDTAAAWAGTLTTIQDGDAASEATMDQVVDTIGDRLGALKTAADGKLSLASNTDQTLSGTGDIVLSSGKEIIAGSSSILTLSSNGLSIGQSAINNVNALGQLRINYLGELKLFDGSNFTLQSQVLPDADGTISYSPVSRVPTLTSNRTYTLTFIAVFGSVVRIVRTVTSNHSVTINGGASGTIAVIPANSQGWVECINAGGGTADWRVLEWGGTVTSILASN